MRELKIGDKYKDNRVDEQDIWEVVEVVAGYRAIVKCIDSGLYQSYKVGDVKTFNLNSSYWEYVPDKSNNFKIIYDILNNP
jgi:hypothetical protein